MASSDAEVIQEFLVAVGIKVDQGALDKFEGIIATIGKRVLLLGAAILSAGAAIEVFVTKMADKMEDLYWSSQRLHDSVSAIQSYTLGIRNLGGTAEGATQSMEGLARLMRTNPGYAGFLKNLGVNPNQGGAHLMNALGERFKQMPYFMANQYAQSLGIDEQTLWAMTHAPRGGVLGGQDKYAGLYKQAGVDPDQAAKKAHEFNVQIRDLEAHLSVIAQAMAYRLLPVAEKFTQWLISFSNVALGWLSHLSQKDIQHWADVADDLAKKLGVVGDALYRLAIIVEFLTGKIPSTWKLPHSVGDAASNAKANLKAIAGPIGNAIFGATDRAVSAIDPRGVRSYFEAHGWTAAQASGIAANVQAESQGRGGAVGDNGQAYGLAQWHPDRQKNFAAWAGHSIQQSTIEEQLAFIQHELTAGSEQKAGRLLRAAKTAADAASILTREYERPANTARQAASRAASAEKIVQIKVASKTEIKVSGASDPKAVAAQTAAKQDRVNGDLVRNLRGALQ